MVLPRFKVFRFSKGNPTGHMGSKKEEEADRNPTGHIGRKKEEEADRRRYEKKISKSGQEWTLQAELGRLKTGQDGKGLSLIHLWCPNDVPRYVDR